MKYSLKVKIGGLFFMSAFIGCGEFEVVPLPQPKPSPDPRYSQPGTDVYTTTASEKDQIWMIADPSEVEVECLDTASDCASPNTDSTNTSQ